MVAAASFLAAPSPLARPPCPRPRHSLCHLACVAAARPQAGILAPPASPSPRRPLPAGPLAPPASPSPRRPLRDLALRDLAAGPWQLRRQGPGRRLRLVADPRGRRAFVRVRRRHAIARKSRPVTKAAIMQLPGWLLLGSKNGALAYRFLLLPIALPNLMLMEVEDNNGLLVQALAAAAGPLVVALASAVLILGDVGRASAFIVTTLALEKADL
ncbi:hypothetical protein ZWY2020_032852 [Hordeum vulgare]|nr:hypothetical protein ZWY2020_032852 [Hordeum vulgare]